MEKDANDLPPQRRIGDFRIIRELGRGGMGVVYEAEQISLNRKVALKILPFHLGSVEESVLKFRREAKAGGRQRHPGIVAIYGIGEHEGIHFIAQELVEGSQTLADKLVALRKSDDLPTGYFREIANCITAVADALHHAHETGVIHRDVKPSNILLTQDESPKITDFGLAKVEDALNLSRTGDFAGTPQYMSPEQVTGKGKGVDRRTDIYSLGVTLYEMLTLRPPFEGESSYEVLKKIPIVDPIDPRRLNPRVPRDLSTICLKAMEKSPEKRYRTMKEFGDDLRRYLSGEVVLARPTGAAVKILRRINRNPLLSVAAGAAALAVLALTVWVVVYFIQMKSRYDEIMRYSDLNLVYRLKVEAGDLWPAYPWKAQGMKGWLDEATGLLARRERYRSEWNLLRTKAEIRVEERERKAYLERLIPKIETLGDEASGLIRDVAKRLRFAETVRRESIDKRQAAWDEAIASIADRKSCPPYDGLVIDPILGFIPIGRDPDSGLWEFVHIQTGEKPSRDTEGKLVLREETGLVFVLIPAGTFRMGALMPDDVDYFEGDPNVDPEARSFEGPVRHVTFEKPFLLSKYEMTQGQWRRFTGSNPSKYKPGDIYGDKEVNLLHPVTNVSWVECDRILFQLNIRLPSEAEWEYACRAGTSTVYWTGNEKETLIGAANIRDMYHHENMGLKMESYNDWLDDGHAVHAPVGTYKPNRFGLHDVIGNAWEWCQDSNSTSYEGAPTDGSAFESPDSTHRVHRGGCCWTYEIPKFRSAYRHWWDQTHSAGAGGVRPAFSLP